MPIINVTGGALGSVVYKGTWDADTNNPVLGDGGAGGAAGEYYIVGVAGTTSVDGVNDWEIGDWIVHNGTTWQKVDNTEILTVGLLADRPISGKPGAMYYATDEQTLYHDTGFGWEGRRSWQHTVEDILNAPPGGLGPADSGRRFLVSGNPTPASAFDGHKDEIAIYFDDGVVASWTFVTPEYGWFINVARNEGNEVYEYYDGSLPPTGDSRAPGWQLRSNQNVGTSAGPTFASARLTATPIHQDTSAIRRKELTEYSWQGAIIDAPQIAPPTPSLGDRYIVRDDTITPEWVGNENKIAVWTFGGGGLIADFWQFYTPQEGWAVWNQADNTVYTWGPGGGWIRQGTVYDRFSKSLLSLGQDAPDMTYAVRLSQMFQYVFGHVVIDSTLATPPGGPNPWDRYIVPAGATDDWAGQTGKIAIFRNSYSPLNLVLTGSSPAFPAPQWLFLDPTEGMVAYDQTNNLNLQYNGATWAPIVIPAPVNPSDAANKQYVDTAVTGLLDYKGPYDPNTDTLESPAPGVVKKGDMWTITVDGLFYTEQVRAGDAIISEVDDPAALADWTVVQRNLDLATETVAGIAEIATAAEVGAEVDDARIVTPTKLKSWLHKNRHVTGGTDEIPGASAVSSGLVNLIAQTLAGQKTFLEAIRIAVLNSGDEIITTDTNGQLQESGVKVTVAPAGGSGFTFVEYAVAPVNPPAGFVWVQAKDANTKTLNYYNGIVTFSVDLSV